MSNCTENIELNTPESIGLFDRFGEDHDRFSFPGPVYRVTGGHGGEAILIVGSEKTVLLDCGMAYAGDITVDNIHKVLEWESCREGGSKGNRSLDFVLLSHSHYDHMGALPIIRKAFPGVEVFGSAHCAKVLERDGAKELIKDLSETARRLYDPDSEVEFDMEGIHVDRVLEDGSCLYIGSFEGEDMYIEAFETPGHTNCSMSFLLQPIGLLFASESTGIPEGEDYVHTPCLKSFIQGIDSAEKCRSRKAAHVCLPHFGMIPDSYAAPYWDDFVKECRSKTLFIKDMKDMGLDKDEMFRRYVDRYWTPTKEAEQPKRAFEINSGHILKVLLREHDELKEHFGL